MNEVSIEEKASFNGRSLSTLKRKSKKISDLTPKRWVIQKRLIVAEKTIHKEGGEKFFIF